METDQGMSEVIGQAGYQDEATGVSSDNQAPNDVSKPESGRKKKSALSSALLQTCKDVVKLFEAISNHDELSSNQRALVRSLVDKQSVALDRKLNGLSCEEGESFESLSKVLRKENNRLDALLEGKEAMFKRFHDASALAEQALLSLKTEIKNQEDES